MLVGAATAIKLVPGIFIPYLWLSGRRRAAAVATATFVTLTLAGAALTPTDSKTFWTSRVFDNSRVGSIGYVSNQSLNGMLVRAFGLARATSSGSRSRTVVVVFGLRRAAIASRRGQELNGIALVALVGLLASPVSWIHHLVWIVPVLAVLVGNATDRRRRRARGDDRVVVRAAASLPRRQHPTGLASRLGRGRAPRLLRALVRVAPLHAGATRLGPRAQSAA